MINTKHKDTLFRKLFGDPAHKENLLSLCNALNHTAYTDLDDVEVNTLEDVIYMKFKNDVSCIVDNYMTLTEHQSTYNPNMPLRGLLYFSSLYEKHISPNKKFLYGKQLLRIPTPRYFVLYNGEDSLPDTLALRLSDAFIHRDESGDFEWTATLININPGHSRRIFESCDVLREYSLFIDRIHQYRADGLSTEAAIRRAVDICIESDILKDFLTKHKAEVIGMCLTEYDEKETLEFLKKESFEEGKRMGEIKGEIKGAIKGAKEEAVSSARKMIRIGLPDDIILQCSTLEAEEIRRLRESEKQEPVAGPEIQQ